MEEMNVGDIVYKQVSTSAAFNPYKTATQRMHPEEARKERGRVVYIHTQGRFYVAEFNINGHIFRETYRRNE